MQSANTTSHHPAIRPFVPSTRINYPDIDVPAELATLYNAACLPKHSDGTLLVAPFAKKRIPCRYHPCIRQMLHDPFLELRHQDTTRKPTLLAVCAGYEQGVWRCESFAQHLILDWLLDFAMSSTAKQKTSSLTAGRQLQEAARKVYQSKNYKKRGEFGELILHAIMRQFYHTVPAISKIWIKTGVNDTVKGFDAVHITTDGETLELWLGEVKFYKDANVAIRDITSEIKDHFRTEYLRNECMIIRDNLDSDWQHTELLSKLISPLATLDRIATMIHVPVMITYDSDTIANHDSVTDLFSRELVHELETHWSTFAKQKLPDLFTFHFVLLPLRSKDNLATALDDKLKKLQAL